MAAPSPSPPPNLLSPPHFRPEKAYFFLRTCSNFPQLKQIHAKIIRHDLANDQLLARHLITLSSSFGETRYASLVFRQLHSPSTFTWNLMIRSLSVNNKPREALLLFVLMLTIHSQFDKFTFPFVIKACLADSSPRLGTQVHGLAITTGLFSDVFLQNTLMDLYFKCGRPDCGRKVFDEMPGRNIVSWTTMLNGLVSNERLDDAEIVFGQMPTRNVVSWTAMIAAYVKNRRPDEAFQLFRRMQVDDVEPNEFTLVSMLQASTQLGSLSMGRWVHDYAHKNGFLLDCFLGTALIDMYRWEDDETVLEAASREAMEEAGVKGILREEPLGVWEFRSKSSSAEPDCCLGGCKGYMFSLEVTEELATWPEHENRERRWLNVKEALELCRYEWMQCALEEFLRVMAEDGRGKEETLAASSLSNREERQIGSSTNGTEITNLCTAEMALAGNILDNRVGYEICCCCVLH
ncbi:hypothetical protein DY000_02025338 [Brassica cretica]|uniref:Nudix hydrolase domain-containing protein n=1 Tax=Brassica cretica TaxID=69181 RepID=A0ABQ7E7Q2_BRACR|nr:hypothetical protein DY000_02025338 [Brassica cretica]